MKHYFQVYYMNSLPLSLEPGYNRAATPVTDVCRQYSVQITIINGWYTSMYCTSVLTDIALSQLKSILFFLIAQHSDT